MRRHGNLYEKIINTENLELAYNKARKGKSWQRAIKLFNQNIPGNIQVIEDLLKNKSYQVSPYTIKIIAEPKKREIFSLPFNPDRIIHHAIMNIIEPIWEGLFIYDSYACRIGKGLHAGSRRTMEFIRQNQFVLKCDISKFYPSMNHDILYRIVERKIKCQDTLWLLREIIYSMPGGQNVPIGNYTSQWFGNLYLNELDHFLKHIYKIRHYIRYCDDFILFSNEKSYLRDMAGAIREFLSDKLKLRLSKCSLFPISQGVDFLGYRHFKKYILLRKSTAKRIKKRLAALPGLYRRGLINLDQLRSSIDSISGWLKWANTNNLSIALQIDNLRNEFLGI